MGVIRKLGTTLVVALTVMAAVPLEQAKSNLATYWEAIPGVEAAPAWMTATLDNWVLWIGPIILLGLAMTSWRVRSAIRNALARRKKNIDPTPSDTSSRGSNAAVYVKDSKNFEMTGNRFENIDQAVEVQNSEGFKASRNTFTKKDKD